MELKWELREVKRSCSLYCILYYMVFAAFGKGKLKDNTILRFAHVSVGIYHINVSTYQQFTGQDFFPTLFYSTKQKKGEFIIEEEDY